MRRRYVMIISAILGVLLLVGAYFTLPTIFGSVVVPWPEEYQQPLLEAAKKYNIDSCLGAATINIESRWNATAKSHAGAQGLGQIVSGTFNSIAHKYDIDNSRGRNDGVTSINVMMAYHRYNTDAYGNDLRNLAVAYNAGGGWVKRPNSSLPLETRSYITKLARNYELYATVYPNLCTGPKVSGGPNVTGVTGNTFAEFNAPATPKPIDISNFWKSFLAQ